MTIKTRNRILLIFFTITSVLLALSIFQFVFAYLNNGITPPENPVRMHKVFSSKGIFSYNFNACIIGIFVFCIYVPAVAIIIYASFEKTQSIEIIYFTLFLLGCVFESLRLLIAEFGLWQTYSEKLIYIGKAIIGGRILVPLSLFFASMFSDSSQRQNVERNIIMLIVISIALGTLYPLNTIGTTTTCAVLWGYSKMFLIIRIFIFISTFATMLFNSIMYSKPSMIKSMIGFIMLSAGYLILISCDCYFSFVLGTALLVLGTEFYLKSIHAMYLWN